MTEREHCAAELSSASCLNTALHTSTPASLVSEETRSRDAPNEGSASQVTCNDHSPDVSVSHCF